MPSKSGTQTRTQTMMAPPDGTRVGSHSFAPLPGVLLSLSWVNTSLEHVSPRNCTTGADWVNTAQCVCVSGGQK